MDNSKRSLTKQKTAMYALWFLTFAIMMIIGTSRDLEIDKAVFNYQNKFALFMENYGMLPVYTVKLLAYSVLVVSYHKLDSALDIMQSFLPFVEKFRKSTGFRAVAFVLLHIIYVLFLYGAFTGSGELFNFFTNAAGKGSLYDIMVDGKVPKFIASVLWFIARLALEALVIFLFSKISREKLKALEFMAIAGLFLYEGSNVINWLKEYFHRVRFREMIAYYHSLIDASGRTYRGDSDMPKEWVENTYFNAYTPWYKKGDSSHVYSESNSFPSGHTAAAAFAMLLPMLASKTKNAAKIFAPAFIIGFAYTLTVGITRLVRGAHFLTDIAAAAIIMLLMLMVIMGIMNYLERYSENKLRRIKRRNERNRENGD